MRSEENRILINASQPGEIRVALLEEQQLSDLDIEYSGHEQKKSNIYKGKISRVEPSLEAAFIDYGAERHGFLPFKEIAPAYLKSRSNESSAIKNSLKVGQEMMVQIEKEERGNKGAALTTYITLPGSYLVLMPNNPGAGGISRRIEGEERREMQDLLSQMPLPEEMGLILRTAGVGRELNELQNDLNLLRQQWNAIEKAFSERSAPFLIFQEGDLITRSIRDYLRRDIGEIIIDDKKIYEKVKNYIEQIRPDFVSRITLYQKPTPIFMHFGIEEDVESAFQREIRLPSGGTIVIDRAEALVAIDINSGRSTKNEDIEETAVKTNLEAAKEIAHQLRVRDLGGLIVIDFIDMNSEDNKRKVENCLREATKKDRARIQIGRLSSFGLLEMSRQRLRHSLGKANETLCQRCHGEGTIRSIESLTLSLLRSIEKEALKKSMQQIRVEIPVDMATYLMNEKRQAIHQIEQRYKINLLLIPNPYWQTPQYKITGLGKTSALNASENASYQLAEKASETSLPYHAATVNPIETPAVKSLVFATNKHKTKSQLGLLSRLFCLLKDLGKAKTQTTTKPNSELATATANPRANETYRNRHQAERRYASGNKVNRNNHRNRGPRREANGGGSYQNQNQNQQQQQAHRHLATGQNNRYEQPPQKSSHANKPTPTVVNEKKPVAKRRPPERSAYNDPRLTDKPKAENTAIHKAALNTEHKKAVMPTQTVAKPEIAIEKNQTVSATTVGATTNTANANATTGNTAPLQRHRRNTRRYGGEPKLRHRTYSNYETPDHKTKGS